MSYTYVSGKNPILNIDCPDPDVIFADGAFYMISTSMHYMPGAQILRSYDLINWEHAAYVYERLDGTEGQKLGGFEHIYGKGMWAATFRYHKGIFYIIFVCNDTHKTYLYRSQKIEGPWDKSIIEGFYHDCSLLFVDDRPYLVYGNTDIYLTELNRELTGPKEGGLHRCILSDEGNNYLGYEGSHMYKINGRYYLFLIHSKRDRWKRVEACFSSGSLKGDFTGGDIFDDDLGFRDSGIAQGGIVEGPEGVWNAVLFQDSGAVGRIPVVVPVKWEEDEGGIMRPVFGIDGKATKDLNMISLKPDHVYRPLTGNDDFKYDPHSMREKDKTGYGCYGLKSIWQFNHEPDLSLIGCDANRGKLWIETDKTVTNIFHARNILTQRMTFPECTAEVTIDGSMLNDGDFAGLAAFQGDYALVGIKNIGGKLYAAMSSYTNPANDIWRLGEELCNTEESLELIGNNLRVRLNVVFSDETGDRDTAVCSICENGKYRKIGTEHKLRFRLDHFTGCRFGLFVYSEKTAGGKAGFRDFRYITDSLRECGT